VSTRVNSDDWYSEGIVGEATTRLNAKLYLPINEIKAIHD